MTVTSEIIDHCSKFKMCKGCRFNGNECIAPLSNHNDINYQKWVETMNNKIKAELK